MYSSIIYYIIIYVYSIIIGSLQVFTLYKAVKWSLPKSVSIQIIVLQRRNSCTCSIYTTCICLSGTSALRLALSCIQLLIRAIIVYILS